MISNTSKSKEHLVCVNFNQEKTCAAFGTIKGFSIYKTSPFRELISRSKQHNITILYRSGRWNKENRNVKHHKHSSFNRRRS